MKKLFTPLLLVLAVRAYAQRPQQLQPLRRAHDDIKPDKAVIYGNFRDTWHLESPDEYVKITDSATEAVYEFRAKISSSGSKKYNPFCYYLPPGTYFLQAFTSVYESMPVMYIPVTWPVRKNAGLKELKRLQKADSLDLAGYQKFKFTVAPGTLNYVGTWNASTDTFKIYNDREHLDRRLTRGLQKYDKLDFYKAQTNLPQ